MFFYVYLITSLAKNKTISYVGYTKDIKNRLKLHNSGKGAKFTRGKNGNLYIKKIHIEKKSNDRRV